MPKELVVVAKVLQSDAMILFIKSILNLRKLSALLSFFLCFQLSYAQYNFQLKKALGYGLGSGLVLGTSLILQNKVKPLTINQINLLEIKDVYRFDRVACSLWNPKMAHASDYLAMGSVLLPTYFYFRNQSREDVYKIANVAVQSILLAQAFANISKLSLRNRPYMYNKNVDVSEKLKSDSRMSFFSAHTSMVSSSCFSFALACQTYQIDKRAMPYIWTGAALLPAVQGYLRVRAGKHYPSDVIVGYLAGLGSAFLMHHLHK
jgi:membrane-associated phospholipid phosphatase